MGFLSLFLRAFSARYHDVHYMRNIFWIIIDWYRVDSSANWVSLSGWKGRPRFCEDGADPQYGNRIDDNTDVVALEPQRSLRFSCQHIPDAHDKWRMRRERLIVLPSLSLDLPPVSTSLPPWLIHLLVLLVLSQRAHKSSLLFLGYAPGFLYEHPPRHHFSHSPSLSIDHMSDFVLTAKTVSAFKGQRLPG